MLEKEYKTYLTDSLNDDEDLTIYQIIARLLKQRKITPETGVRLKKIFDTLVQLPDVESFKIVEALAYNSDNELDNLKMELAFLIGVLISKNKYSNSENENINRFKHYFIKAKENKLSEDEINRIKQEIIFAEIDNGYKIKFYVSADNYLKEKIKEYYIRK